jgi:hypothetical protein
MNIEDYFKSLTQEFTGLKNRVRNFIAGNHWQTDGEWKESVLRSFLARSLPQTVQVGRGFIIGHSETSTQIDILLYASDAPVMFRDGDLVFVSPEAVRGIIEVKTNLNANLLSQALDKLIKVANICSHNNALIGIFSYDSTIQSNTEVLSLLRDKCKNRREVIDLLCLGDSHFIKYWQKTVQGGGTYEKWHSYELRHMAFGYFIHNVILSLTPDHIAINESVWFPENSKEIHKDGEIYRNGAIMERLLGSEEG